MRDARRLLRMDAVLGAAIGALLLASSWDALFEALDAPVPDPALYAQFLGAVLLASGYVLWTADDPQTVRRLVAAAAAVNGAGAVIVAVWLLSGDLDTGALGTTLLAALCAVLVLFCVVEARIARKEIA